MTVPTLLRGVKFTVWDVGIKSETRDIRMAFNSLLNGPAAWPYSIYCSAPKAPVGIMESSADWRIHESPCTVQGINKTHITHALLCVCDRQYCTPCMRSDLSYCKYVFSPCRMRMHVLRQTRRDMTSLRADLSFSLSFATIINNVFLSLAAERHR